MKNKLIERLISYAKVDTQSNENSQTTPSTPGQLTLANMLVEELKEIGMKDVTIDENGYVMATLPSNTEKRCRRSASWLMWIQQQILPERTSIRRLSNNTTERTLC